MVKYTTLAIIQTIFGLLAIIVNGSLQTYGLIQLNKTSLVNDDIKSAKKTLLAAIITQFVAAGILIAALVWLIVYGNKFQEHKSKFVYSALILAGVLMIVGGSLGANVALKLQCYRSDPMVQKAWSMSTYSAIVGIVGAMLMILVQAFVRKDYIKNIVRRVVAVKGNAPPMKTVPTIRQKAAMPSYHPPPYKRDDEFYFASPSL